MVAYRHGSVALTPLFGFGVPHTTAASFDILSLSKDQDRLALVVAEEDGRSVLLCFGVRRSAPLPSLSRPCPPA